MGCAESRIIAATTTTGHFGESGGGDYCEYYPYRLSTGEQLNVNECLELSENGKDKLKRNHNRNGEGCDRLRGILPPAF